MAHHWRRLWVLLHRYLLAGVDNIMSDDMSVVVDVNMVVGRVCGERRALGLMQVQVNDIQKSWESHRECSSLDFNLASSVLETRTD